jgi:tRNA(Arg) A34 adenosine deaminase TadA
MNINYSRLLDLILKEIIPLTYKNVEKGNKVFGGAIVSKVDLTTICIGVNNEIINPLLHGEISTINNFFKKNKKINPIDCIFVSTHEPCSLCLSAITWAGFNNFYYFFPYEDTKDKFNIPHDLNILSQVFNIAEGKYNDSNFYWKSFSILNEINKLPSNKRKTLKFKINQIYKKYEDLSLKYQESKKENKIPLN